MKVAYLILSFCLTSLVIGQSPEEAVNFFYNQDGVGAKAKAMGNAFVGIADDYSAIYWNPAGLTQLNTSEIQGDLYHLNYNNEATFKGNTVLEDRNFTKFKSIGLAYKFPTTQGNLVIAFGYNRIKDYDNHLYFSGFNTESNGMVIPVIDDNDEEVEYSFDKQVLQTEKISEDGNLANWSIGGGIMLSPNFSIGLTLNFYSGSNQYLFDFYQDDIDYYYTQYPADFDSYELHHKIISDFSGWGATLGALFQLNKSLRLGLAIDFPTSLNILETYSKNDVLYYDDGYMDEVDYGGYEWEYNIDYPFKFSAGVAFDLNQFTLAASFDYRDWAQTAFDVPSGYSLSDDFNELLDENKYFPDQFRATSNYHFGGEYRIKGSGIKLRGGYRYVPSPLVDADQKLDRQYFSAGLGYEMDNNSTLNISYTKGYWTKDSVDGYTPGGTHESIETGRFIGGISYRF